MQLRYERPQSILGRNGKANCIVCSCWHHCQHVFSIWLHLVSNMICPNCKAKKMPVTLTRVQDDYVYRRRMCTVCDTRMTTVEMYAKGNLDADMPPHRPNRTKK